MPEYWWLETKWLKHRNSVRDLHSLLVELQQARETGFMTLEHVLAVLDAKDPAGLVGRWMSDVVATGLAPRRRCQWPGCRKEKAGYGPAAKFCAEHSAASAKIAKRKWRRGRQSVSPGCRKIDG